MKKKENKQTQKSSSLRGTPLQKELLAGLLKNLPQTPGVYQMKDAKGGVMYVGKAKNLKNRVSSYFVRPGELSPAKRQMVAKVCDIEIITCQTEVEALVLETNLIKHLTPKYNILMKDDKNLAYLKFTNSPVPELIKTRQRIPDGGIYFGPFVAGVEQTIRALRKIFQIRNCRMKFGTDLRTQSLSSGGTIASTPLVGEDPPQIEADSSYRRNDNCDIIITDKAGKSIPCMDYYIGLCPAPCLLTGESLAKHADNMAQAYAFLSGDTVKVFAELTDQMHKKAKNLEFEEAQEIKETLEALKGLYEKQKVRDIIEGNVDICVVYEKYDRTYIGYTQIRVNQIVGVFRYEVDIHASDKDDVIYEFLMRQYISNEQGLANSEQLGDMPDLLLLQNMILDESFLDFLSTKQIKIEIPKIGPKKDIIDFTLKQVREYVYKKELASLENKILTRENMKNVLERLGYPVPVKGEIVFECYDISHTDGHFTYASRVCIVDGKPDTSRYKKYKIKTLQDGDIDDFASHREVMTRRTLEGLEQDNFPHLIIIDGGKGQLSSAVSGVKEGIWKSNNSTVDLCHVEAGDILPNIEQDFSSSPQKQVTLSKGQKQSVDHNNVTLPNLPFSGKVLPSICSIAKREEEIFLPGEKNPILFEKGTPELMVLQRARDESHRFSITANKTARMKSMKKNILEEIPGIGPVTRKKLLKLAGSVDGIRGIAIEEISKICNVAQIETLRDHGII